MRAARQRARVDTWPVVTSRPHKSVAMAVRHNPRVHLDGCTRLEVGNATDDLYDLTNIGVGDGAMNARRGVEHHGVEKLCQGDRRTFEHSGLARHVSPQQHSRVLIEGNIQRLEAAEISE